MKISRLLLIVLCCWTAPILAAESLSQQLTNCASITSDAKRLACFDSLTKTTPVPVPAAKKSSDIFGFEDKQINKLSPQQIAVKVVSVSSDARGKKIFTLVNGQVWRQTEYGTYHLKTDKAVFIKKGALGSFFLGQVDRNRKIRVKRIK